MCCLSGMNPQQQGQQGGKQTCSCFQEMFVQFRSFVERMTNIWTANFSCLPVDFFAGMPGMMGGNPQGGMGGEFISLLLRKEP